MLFEGLEKIIKGSIFYDRVSGVIMKPIRRKLFLPADVSVGQLLQIVSVREYRRTLHFLSAKMKVFYGSIKH